MSAYDLYWQANPYTDTDRNMVDAETHAFNANHRRVTPQPEFAALCDTAEQWGMHVHLTVHDQLLGNPDREFRLLSAIRIGENYRHPAIVVGVGSHTTGLRDAAARALDRLVDA